MLPELEFYVSPMFLAFVPLVVALVAVVKNYIDNYWTPLVSLGIGLLVAIIALDVPWGETIISGLAIGLMSSGLWSSSKSLFHIEKFR